MRELLTDLADADDGTDHADAVSVLKAELTADCWTPQKEVGKALIDAGFTKTQAWKASKKLNVLRRKGGMDEGWYLLIPVPKSELDITEKVYIFKTQSLRLNSFWAVNCMPTTVNTDRTRLRPNLQTWRWRYSVLRLEVTVNRDTHDIQSICLATFLRISIGQGSTEHCISTLFTNGP